MANFALNTTDPYSEVVSSLNYVIANLGTTAIDGNVLIANVTNGEITSNGSVVSYLYQYMDVQYANSSTGGSGFSSNSFNRSYYGLRNTSVANPISFNPADYVWYQVTGGFGTTKTLWYQTIGGRQVQFFPNVSAPAASFISVPDMPTANSTPLNLDTITSAQNNQIVNVNAYYQANVTPATPAGGTYNFTTFVLTPPSGWTANIPSSGNTSVYVSTATFVGNTNATAAPPATDWNVPTVYSSSFQGNTGPAGSRGFVPMGFVITASDPTTYGNVDFTNAFESSRSNPSPPIGLGFAPIANDTAQFAYQNLFTGNTITTVQQYNGTGWTPVVGDVVSGGLFVPGSINANTLNVNQVYALTIASTNANVGNVQSNGFWMQSSNGDARLAGNTSIGNNLTVGNNAVIGGFASIGSNVSVGNGLTVANNASIGGFASIGSNVSVGNGLTVANNAVIGGFASIGSNISVGNGLTVGTSATIGNNVTVANNAVIGGFARIGSSVSIGNNLTVANNAVIGGNLNVTGLITTGSLNANVVATTTIVPSAVSTTVATSSSTPETSSLAYGQSTIYTGISTTITNTQQYPTLATCFASGTIQTGSSVLEPNTFATFYCSLLSSHNSSLYDIVSFYVNVPIYPFSGNSKTGTFSVNIIGLDSTITVIPTTAQYLLRIQNVTRPLMTNPLTVNINTGAMTLQYLKR